MYYSLRHGSPEKKPWEDGNLRENSKGRERKKLVNTEIL
jgi:hypothetical protein